MRTHDGNPGAVLADVGAVTFAQLAAYKIPYHEIHFGKPYADVYIDDLAVNSNLDTMREIGWLLDSPVIGPESSQPNGAGPGANGIDDRMVASRSFNTIQVIDGKVIKSSKSDHILGELYFYAHMTPELAPLFPSVYNLDFIAETGTYTITMSNIRGLTFSHLLAGRSITRARFQSFLSALHKLHVTPWAERTLSSRPVPSAALAAMFAERSVAASSGPSESDTIANIYANYQPKLRARYAAHPNAYAALGPDAAAVYTRLDEFLGRYEREGHGVAADVVHGDAVFSNAILTAGGGQAVRFVDVRCQLGERLTTAGDVCYDLAKVLQSLSGYDHVLLLSERRPADAVAEAARAGALLDQADRDILAALQDQFFGFVRDTYGERVQRRSLLYITASLFFTLIPLHAPYLGPVFFSMCEDVLAQAEAAEEPAAL